MRILLSNDDGITAPGLNALREAVEGLGETDVVAPDSPQSAAAHAITLKAPLVTRNVQLPGDRGRRGVSVNGRPADCVRLAIRNLLPEPPELVLSGVNHGSNVGINVFYSGTVAAAAEAAMLAIPAVAFSAAMPREGGDFARAARLCRWVLDELLRVGLSGGDLINVNIPDLSAGPLRGLRVAAQSTAGIDDVYLVEHAADGSHHYRLGEQYSFFSDATETDVTLLSEGYITVTPLHVDMTNHDRLAVLARGRWADPPA